MSQLGAPLWWRQRTSTREDRLRTGQPSTWSRRRRRRVGGANAHMITWYHITVQTILEHIVSLLVVTVHCNSWCFQTDWQKHEQSTNCISLNREKGCLLPTSVRKITANVLTECSSWHFERSCRHFDWMLQSVSPWWQLEHSVETSASYFPNSSW